MDENETKKEETLDREDLKRLAEILATVRHGSVTLIIQNGKVVQIERNEKSGWSEGGGGMERFPGENKKNPDYQNVLLEKIKKVRDGRISIIKQDGKVIQINVSDLVDIHLAKRHKGAHY